MLSCAAALCTPQVLPVKKQKMSRLAIGPVHRDEKTRGTTLLGSAKCRTLLFDRITAVSRRHFPGRVQMPPLPIHTLHRLSGFRGSLKSALHSTTSLPKLNLWLLGSLFSHPKAFVLNHCNGNFKMCQYSIPIFLHRSKFFRYHNTHVPP